MACAYFEGLSKVVAFGSGEILLVPEAALELGDLALGEEDARLAALALFEKTGLVTLAHMVGVVRVQLIHFRLEMSIRMAPAAD